MRVAFKESGPGFGEIVPIKHQTVWGAAEPLAYSLFLGRPKLSDLREDYTGPWVPVFRAFGNELVEEFCHKGHTSVPYDGMFGRMQVTSAFNDDLISHRGCIACSGRFFVSAYMYGIKAPEKDRSVLMMALPAEVLLDDNVTLLSEDDYMFFTRVLGRMIMDRISTLKDIGATAKELQEEREAILKLLKPVRKGRGSVQPWIDWFNNRVNEVINDKVGDRSLDDVAYGIGKNAGQLLNYRWVQIANKLEYGDRNDDEKYELLIKTLREDEFVARFIDNFEQRIAEESRANKARLREIIKQTRSSSEAERREGYSRLNGFMDSIEEVIMEPEVANGFLETTRRFQLNDDVLLSMYKTNIFEDAVYLPQFMDLERVMKEGVSVLSSIGQVSTERETEIGSHRPLGDSRPAPTYTKFSVDNLFSIEWHSHDETRKYPSIVFKNEDPKRLFREYEAFMKRLEGLRGESEAIAMLLQFLQAFYVAADFSPRAG